MSIDLTLFKEGASREDILALQDSIAENLVPVDCPVTHHFAPGLYAREIFMPAGSVVVGKIHKHAHVNNISKGSVVVVTEFGREAIVAPAQFISKPGTKRCVYVIENCIWTTYHPTDKTDLAEIEADVIAESYDELDKLAYTDIKGLIQ
jgi:hypothetical protein